MERYPKVKLGLQQGNPTQIAEQLRPFAKSGGKPVLASWMGGNNVQAGVEILNQAGIPTFTYPDTATVAFNYMWKYSYNLKSLYETPAAFAEDQDIFDQVLPRLEEALAEAANNGVTDSFQLQQIIRRTVGSWLGGRLRRRPMIIPIVIDA